MARHSIVEKLDRELRLPLRRESQVLYIMAEIRKLIEYERGQQSKAYDTLELFCNWALHTSITRKANSERIKLFLSAFDMKTGMGLTEYLRSAFFNKIMHLEVLRREIERFFREHDLPCGTITSHRGWSAFIYLYTSIISDVPLQNTGGDLLPDEVESVTITRLPQTATPQMMTRWAVKLSNGEAFAGATLYGQYRNDAGVLVGEPDFFDEHFQLL